MTSGEVAILLLMLVVFSVYAGAVLTAHKRGRR